MLAGFDANKSAYVATASVLLTSPPSTELHDETTSFLYSAHTTFAVTYSHERKDRNLKFLRNCPGRHLRRVQLISTAAPPRASTPAATVF